MGYFSFSLRVLGVPFLHLQKDQILYPNEQASRWCSWLLRSHLRKGTASSDDVVLIISATFVKLFLSTKGSECSCHQENEV